MTNLKALPFNSENDMQTGETRAFAYEPKEPVTLERLLIPADIGTFFRVKSLVVGHLAVVTDKPASDFSENAESVFFQENTNAYIGQIITLVVTNDGPPSRFAATIIGTECKKPPPRPTMPRFDFE